MGIRHTRPNAVAVNRRPSPELRPGSLCSTPESKQLFCCKLHESATVALKKRHRGGDEGDDVGQSRAGGYT